MACLIHFLSGSAQQHSWKEWYIILEIVSSFVSFQSIIQTAMLLWKWMLPFNYMSVISCCACGLLSFKHTFGNLQYTLTPIHVPFRYHELWFLNCVVLCHVIVLIPSGLNVSMWRPSPWVLVVWRLSPLGISVKAFTFWYQTSVKAFRLAISVKAFTFRYQCEGFHLLVSVWRPFPFGISVMAFRFWYQCEGLPLLASVWPSHFPFWRQCEGLSLWHQCEGLPLLASVWRPSPFGISVMAFPFWYQCEGLPLLVSVWRPSPFGISVKAFPFWLQCKGLSLLVSVWRPSPFGIRVRHFPFWYQTQSEGLFCFFGIRVKAFPFQYQWRC